MWQWAMLMLSRLLALSDGLYSCTNKSRWHYMRLIGKRQMGRSGKPESRAQLFSYSFFLSSSSFSSSSSSNYLPLSTSSMLNSVRTTLGTLPARSNKWTPFSCIVQYGDRCCRLTGSRPVAQRVML